jgi:hypothetical protein
MGLATQSIPEAIQAERLTATLRRTGVLGEAHVSNVTLESSRDTILSRIVRVRLTYSAQSDHPAPSSSRLVTLIASEMRCMPAVRRSHFMIRLCH